MKEFTLGKPQGSKPHRSRETILFYTKDGTPVDITEIGAPLDLSELEHDQVIAWAEGPSLVVRDDGGLDFLGHLFNFSGADLTDEYAGVTIGWEDENYGLVFRGRPDEGTYIFIQDPDFPDPHLELFAGYGGGYITAKANVGEQARLQVTRENEFGPDHVDIGVSDQFIGLEVHNASGGAFYLHAGAAYPFSINGTEGNALFSVADDRGPIVYDTGITWWRVGTGPSATIEHATSIQGLKLNKGLGQWGHEPPASIPAAPSDQAGIIALLQSYGMCS